MMVVRMTWKCWAKERHCTVLPTCHYDNLMLGPLCTVCACTCPWSPGPVPVENSSRGNSEQLLGRMLRLESNQCEQWENSENVRDKFSLLCNFRKHVFSLHRFKGRFQQKEETNCWLREPQSVRARQTSWTFLSVAMGGAHSPERSIGLGSWPLGHLLPMWPRVSYLISLTFVFSYVVVSLTSFGCLEDVMRQYFYSL